MLALAKFLKTASNFQSLLEQLFKCSDNLKLRIKSTVEKTLEKAKKKQTIQPKNFFFPKLQ